MEKEFLSKTGLYIKHLQASSCLNLKVAAVSIIASLLKISLFVKLFYKNMEITSDMVSEICRTSA